MHFNLRSDIGTVFVALDLLVLRKKVLNLLISSHRGNPENYFEQEIEQIKDLKRKIKLKSGGSEFIDMSERKDLELVKEALGNMLSEYEDNFNLLVSGDNFKSITSNFKEGYSYTYNRARRLKTTIEYEISLMCV